MSEQENIEIVKKIYSDFGEGNIAGILSVFADDLVFIQPAAGPSPVRGVTGVVVTTRFGRAVAQREATIGRNKVTATPGDEVLLLNYLGEGFWKYWLRGEIDEEFIPDPENCRRAADRSPTMFRQCAVQVDERPETVWWVLIRNDDGQDGWSRETTHFGNMDACG